MLSRDDIIAELRSLNAAGNVDAVDALLLSNMYHPQFHEFCGYSDDPLNPRRLLSHAQWLDPMVQPYQEISNPLKPRKQWCLFVHGIDFADQRNSPTHNQAILFALWRMKPYRVIWRNAVDREPDLERHMDPLDIVQSKIESLMEIHPSPFGDDHRARLIEIWRHLDYCRAARTNAGLLVRACMAVCEPDRRVNLDEVFNLIRTIDYRARQPDEPEWHHTKKMRKDWEDRWTQTTISNRTYNLLNRSKSHKESRR